MESPPPLPLARYISQQSKKRRFPGSSSSYLDPEVVEISPPLVWSSKSKSLKKKEIIHHEVIDIDMDDESEDIMLTDNKVDSSSKGKEALANFSRNCSYSSKPGSMDGVQFSKKSYVTGLNNSLNLKSLRKDFSHGDDEFLDNLTYEDEYAFLQSHFDSIDIPPGVEAPIPWFSDSIQDDNNPDTANSLNRPNFPISLGASGTDSSHSWGLPELAKFEKTPGSSSSKSLHTSTKTQSYRPSVPVSPSLLHVESAQNKNNSVNSISSTYLNSQMERVNSHLDRVAANYPARSKSGSILGYSNSKKKPSLSANTSNYASNSLFDAMHLSSAMESSVRGPSFGSRLKKPVDSGDVIVSKFPSMNSSSLPSGLGPYMFGWQHSDGYMGKLSLGTGGIHNSPDCVLLSEKKLYPSWVQDLANCQTSASAAGSSTVSPGLSPTENHGSDDIQKKFQPFKQFDIVQDHSDHHYSSKDFLSKQPSKNWAKKIQDEWRILEKDLPDTIFVRVYESRMHLLRAVIVGAEGTPYHDGLFFFDVFFPCGYPNVPPLVYYHSGGLRINPNLYACGKVCLSLLNTWGGSSNEKWIPGVSTMLQVLVSIQALILNEKPYFNEPGYARMNGSASGEKCSQQYNESTLLLSLRTMVYTMRKPPKHFEEFVVEHFRAHAQDILSACKAYVEGVQVGCLTKGGVQDVDAGNNSCSQHFKDTLASFITVLVQTFTQTGATDCQMFLSLAEKALPSANKFLNY